MRAQEGIDLRVAAVVHGTRALLISTHELDSAEAFRTYTCRHDRLIVENARSLGA